MGTGLCPQEPAAEGGKWGPCPLQVSVEGYAGGALYPFPCPFSLGSPLVAPGVLQGDLFSF